MFKFFLSFLLFVSLTGLGFASNELVTMKHFSHLDKYVQELVKDKGSKHVLLVFDDDTLLQMPQALGSVGWWNWQTKLLKTDPNSKALVSHNFQGLIDVQELLLDMNYMTLTSPQIPLLLHKWQRQGVTTLVFTARSRKMSNATEHQFKHVGLKSGFKKYSVVTKNGTTSLPGAFHPCNDQKMRPVMYQNGIYYASGQNKGVLLQCFLKQTGKAKQYSAILIIDDTLMNDQDFYKAYQGMKGMDTIAVHYTKLADVKQEQLNIKKLHAQMTKQWHQIKTVLAKNLVEPAL